MSIFGAATSPSLRTNHTLHPEWSLSARWRHITYDLSWIGCTTWIIKKNIQYLSNSTNKIVWWMYVVHIACHTNHHFIPSSKFSFPSLEMNENIWEPFNANYNRIFTMWLHMVHGIFKWWRHNYQEMSLILKSLWLSIWRKNNIFLAPVKDIECNQSYWHSNRQIVKNLSPRALHIHLIWSKCIHYIAYIDSVISQFAPRLQWNKVSCIQFLWARVKNYVFFFTRYLILARLRLI